MRRATSAVALAKRGFDSATIGKYRQLWDSIAPTDRQPCPLCFVYSGQPLCADNKGAEVKKIRRKTFTAEIVLLDNNSYSNCTFNDCHIVYSGITEVSLVGCKFVNCTWGFDGPAARVIRFMGVLYAMGEGGVELIEKTFANIREGKSTLDPKKR